MDVVKLSDSFAEYNEYIEGDDTINGQTLGIITDLLGVAPEEYADVDVLMLIEQVLQNYHLWHKIDAGESE
jgi:hypothetical protein